MNGELTTTITAPARGWLVINAHSAIELNTVGNAQVNCYIQVNNSTVSTSWTEVDLQFSNTTPTYHDNDDCDTAAHYRVCGTGDYTVDFAFSGVQGELVLVNFAVLQVEFIPFGANGAPPSLTTCIVL